MSQEPINWTSDFQIELKYSVRLHEIENIALICLNAHGRAYKMVMVMVGLRLIAVTAIGQLEMSLQSLDKIMI